MWFKLGVFVDTSEVICREEYVRGAEKRDDRRA